MLFIKVFENEKWADVVWQSSFSLLFLFQGYLVSVDSYMNLQVMLLIWVSVLFHFKFSKRTLLSGSMCIYIFMVCLTPLLFLLSIRGMSSCLDNRIYYYCIKSFVMQASWKEFFLISNFVGPILFFFLLLTLQLWGHLLFSFFFFFCMWIWGGDGLCSINSELCSRESSTMFFAII